MDEEFNFNALLEPEQTEQEKAEEEEERRRQQEAQQEEFDFNALLTPEEPAVVEEEIPVEEEPEFDFNALLTPEEPVVVSETPTEEAVEVSIPAELTPPIPKPIESVEQAKDDEQLSFQELASDASYMEMLREYSADRFGEEEGAQENDESNEDYVKRFLSHTREFEFNSLDLGQQLDWVRSADDEKRMKFGYLYSQLDRLPSFYEDGGTGSVSAMRDFGKSLLLDPLNYIGFGVGAVAKNIGTRAIVAALKQGGKKLGKKLAIEEAAKFSAKRMLGTKAGRIAAGGIAVEAGAAAVQDLKLQEVERLSKKYGKDTPEEKDLLRAATIGAFGLAGGVIGTKLAGGLGSKTMLKNARDTQAKQLRIVRELNQRTAKLKKEGAEEAARRSMDATTQSATGVFDIDAGRKALEQLGEVGEGASEVVQAQFKTELMQRVGRVVTNVVEDLAESGKLGQMVDVDTKASEVIGKIVSDALRKTKGASSKDITSQTEELLTGKQGILTEITDLDVTGDVLESAISKAGITNKQFVDAFGASFTDAGKYLQTASRVGKIMKGIKEIDPDLAKQIVGNESANDIIGPMGKAHGFMQRLDRERRALMVSQIATTVRNVATAGTRLTMDMAADLMESSLYQIGRGSDAAMTGNAPRGFSAGVTNVIRDSFGRLDRMRNTVGTAELSEALLKYNPRLATRMDRSLQEVGADQSLSEITRTLNGLNIAQDLFFRRAIFTDVIDKRLRRSGVIVDTPTKAGQYKSLEEFAAAGKSLPADVLADAVDDSLAFTFSRMPKAQGGRAGDSVGNLFIRFNEAIGPVPIPLVGTASIPFGRFMVNALQFQFQYSPTSVVSSVYRYGMAKQIQNLAKASKAAGKADLATKQGREAQKAIDKARGDFSKGIVGTAALMSAIKFRAENQDVKFYEGKNEDGSTSDLRPFFPLVPYLAIADVIVKMGGTSGATLGMVDQPENVSKFDTKEILEAFTGVQFRTGASSFVTDNFVELFNAEADTITQERMSEVGGQFIGELFGAFATPARVVRDVQAAFDTEAAVVRDARQTEGLGPAERFQSALKNTLIKDIPGLAKDLPAIESPTRESDIYRQSPLIGQVTGLRREAKRNPAEAEIVRLGIKNYSLVPGSGDKNVDARVKKAFGPLFEKRIAEFVTSKDYLNKTEPQKRAALNNNLKQQRGVAKQLAKIEAFNESTKSYTPFDRAQYTKLTRIQKGLINEYYAREYDGKSVLEMHEEQPDRNHIKRAVALARVLAKTEN